MTAEPSPSSRSHRPAPRALRRVSRTAWSPGRTILWMTVQLAFVIASLGALWWLLRDPAGP